MMEQPTQNNDEQVQGSTVQPAASLGNMLREARERQGLSVGDVANQIKFAPRQIEALEADDFSAKPEAAFLRGFVRSYGKLLQLDTDTLFAALPETKVTTLSAAPLSSEVAFPNAYMARRPNLIWMSVALLFVVAALGFAISSFNAPTESMKETQVETNVTLPGDMAIVAEQTDEQVVAASAVVSVVPTIEPFSLPVIKVEVKQAEVKSVTPSPVIKPATNTEKSPSTPVVKATLKPSAVTETAPVKAVIPIDTLLGIQPAMPSAVADSASKSSGLRIVFGDESWTEVKDKNGKTLSSQTNPSGSEIHLEGSAPFTLSIAHAKSARLYYKGKQVDLKPYIKKYSEVAHVTLE